LDAGEAAGDPGPWRNRPFWVGPTKGEATSRLDLSRTPPISMAGDYNEALVGQEWMRGSSESPPGGTSPTATSPSSRHELSRAERPSKDWQKSKTSLGAIEDGFESGRRIRTRPIHGGTRSWHGWRRHASLVSSLRHSMRCDPRHANTASPPPKTSASKRRLPRPLSELTNPSLIRIESRSRKSVGIATARPSTRAGDGSTRDFRFIGMSSSMAHGPDIALSKERAPS